MAAIATMRQQRGFTLIELMIAVAIVGILAAVALPAYNAYVRRGKIATALGELSAVRVRLEQFYQDNRNYGSDDTRCGVALPSAPGFTFSCSWGPGGTNSQTFTVKATGDAAAGVGGYTYSVNQSDEQKTEVFEGAEVNLPCWIKKAGDAC